MSSTVRRRLLAPLAILAVSSLALVGCVAVSIHNGKGPGDAGEADGVVTIYGGLSGTEAELLQQSWADWEDENDIRIQYRSINDFEAQIGDRVKGGDAPDLAIFSQPELVSDMAWRNLIQPVPYMVDANLKQYWSNDWAHAVTTNGVAYAAPLTASVNGLVWYSPKRFAAHGWKVPATWDRLVDLTADIHEKLDVAPWCADLGTDAVTSRSGTDWVEDLVLRHAGPYTYDAWVSNDVKFSDPAIKDAFDSLGKILRNPDFVNSGFRDETSINTTPVGDVALAMANGTCLLTHQNMSFGELLADPEGANLTVGPQDDMWAFLLPSLEAGANDVIGGGQIVAAFSNDPDTVMVQYYLSSPEWANSRVALGGAVSANNGVDPAIVSSPILSKAIAILQDPRTTFRFTGTETMPKVVGEGSFPAGVVAWVNNRSVDPVLSTIDASWPTEE